MRLKVTGLQLTLWLPDTQLEGSSYINSYFGFLQVYIELRRYLFAVQIFY